MHIQGHFDYDRNVLRQKSTQGCKANDLDDYDRRLRNEIHAIKDLMASESDAYEKRKLRHSVNSKLTRLKSR